MTTYPYGYKCNACGSNYFDRDLHPEALDCPRCGGTLTEPPEVKE